MCFHKGIVNTTVSTDMNIRSLFNTTNIMPPSCNATRNKTVQSEGWESVWRHGDNTKSQEKQQISLLKTTKQMNKISVKTPKTTEAKKDHSCV